MKFCHVNLSASQATFECRSDTNTIKTGSRDGIDRVIGHAASSGNVFDNPEPNIIFVT